MEFLLEVAGHVVWAFVEICIGVWTGRGKQTRRSLDAVALQLGGRVEKRWFERPCVRFAVDGVSATLRYGEDRDPGGTQADVLFDWKPPHTLRIAPERTFDRVKKWFGAQDIQVHDSGFDERFLIQGSSEEWVRSALDSGTRGAVLAVAHFADDFHIDAGSAGLAVHLARNVADDPVTLAAFARTASDLLRGLRGMSGEGITLLPSEGHAVGRCPVCAQSLAGELRRCTRCHTEHHEECWEYFGRCGIYACGSIHGRTRRGREKLPE